MADRPVIFSAPMIQALLAGSKSQTRRVIKKAAAHDALAVFDAKFLALPGNRDLLPIPASIGDRLWVREAWAISTIYDGCTSAQINPGGKPHWCGIYYHASKEPIGLRKRSPIHMPRWASRLTLTVTDVRVQRLGEITEADAIAEGCPAQTLEDLAGMDPRGWYRDLWNSLHGPDAWDANPWVAALTFTTEQRNIDHAG